MNKEDKTLLTEIIHENEKPDAINIRKNGQTILRKTSPFVDIVPKENNQGLDIYVKENTLLAIVHVPVLLVDSHIKDVVYNDFHIGKNARAIILAGCGIHNDLHDNSEHDGIHRFFVAENAEVTYTEKHYGEGNGSGQKILNPITEIHLQKGASMKMDTLQIKGVDDTVRETKAVLAENTTLVINEKILTNEKECAKTIFEVSLEGNNASTHVTSRSVATENSYQEFVSHVVGNGKCYAHIECDAILKENGQVKAIPEIYAKSPDANLIHEAAIGKIQGEQLNKLMSLGLSEKEAEEEIIKGFLK